MGASRAGVSITEDSVQSPADNFRQGDFFPPGVQHTETWTGLHTHVGPPGTVDCGTFHGASRVCGSLSPPHVEAALGNRAEPDVASGRRTEVLEP